MEQYVKDLEASLSGIVQHFNEEVQGVRSSRPSVGLVENIQVAAYDQNLTVKEVASLGVSLPRTIEVSPWDKGIMGVLAKAIEDAKAGYSVSNDGDVIRVVLPALTDERRAEFAKLAKKIAESSRISIRNQRDDTMKKVRAAQDAKTLSEDQAFKGKERVQKVVDAANQKVESGLEAKLRELAE